LAQLAPVVSRCLFGLRRQSAAATALLGFAERRLMGTRFTKAVSLPLCGVATAKPGGRLGDFMKGWRNFIRTFL